VALVDDETLARARSVLADGPLHRFADALDPELPRVAAGCYTVWDESGRFVYAGMAGRSLTADRIYAARDDPTARTTGLRDRLGAHRNGRRSGDQFSVYVFDRFVLTKLSTDDIGAAAAGRRRLDEDVQSYIRDHLSYRWCETEGGADAYALEMSLVTQGLAGELPLLNPRRIEEP
jgi:hypothetical protein